MGVMACVDSVKSTKRQVLTALRQHFCSAAHVAKTAGVVQVERNLASGAKNLFMPHTLVAEQVMRVVSCIHLSRTCLCAVLYRLCITRVLLPKMHYLTTVSCALLAAVLTAWA